jgi:hypothetical protein
MSSDVEITIAEAADVVAVPAAALSGSDGNYSVRVATRRRPSRAVLSGW